jgi:hypothetical protein
MYRNPAQGDYTGADTTYRYYMNLCGVSNAGGNCTANFGLLCQYDKGVYESMIAQYNSSGLTYSFLSPANPSGGVVLTYVNGDPCSDGSNRPRSAVISLTCDPNAPLPNTIYVREEPGDLCTYYVSMTSPNACPVDTSNNPPRLGNGQAINATSTANGWTYFVTNVETGEQDLTINTKQLTAEGYLELYVRYGAKPTEQSYDRADTSTKASHQVVIRNTDANNPLVTGDYYIGVKAIGATTTFNLQPFQFTCPGNCSNHGSCVYQPTLGMNTCYCNAGYDSNFVDCSAQVIDPAQWSVDYVHSVNNGVWKYYRYEQNDPNSYELVIDLTRATADPGLALPTLMVKQGDWPTYGNNDGIVQDFFTPSASWQLIVPFPAQGFWIVAVVGSPDTIFNYILSAENFDCDNGCSGHGQCIPQNHTCICDDNYGNLDCSLREIPLSPYLPIAITIPPYGTSYYAIDVTPALANAHIDMLVTVAVDDPSGFYPRRLISPSQMGIPTLTNYLLASPLPLSANTLLRIPAGVIEDYPPTTQPVTTWYIGISSYYFNTLRVHIQLSYEGYCVNDCSNNGYCVVDNTTYAVQCICNPGFYGAGCDVTSEEKNSGGDNDNVDTGLAVGLVFIFMFLGVVFGILIKRSFPNLFGRGSDAFSPTTGGQRATYSAMSEESHV